MENTTQEWNITKHATPDYAPQYGIYKNDDSHDFCIVKGDNAEQDANLIASAPQLLKACSLAVDLLRQHEQYEDDEEESMELEVLNACVSAIAQAKG